MKKEMNYEIKNEFIKAKINSFGAELNSLQKVENKFEYIWQADKNYWARHSPVLFPIVIYTTNPIESLNANIKRKTNSKGSFPTIDSAFKMLYMSTQEVQAKWERTSMRNWSEIYP